MVIFVLLEQIKEFTTFIFQKLKKIQKNSLLQKENLDVLSQELSNKNFIFIQSENFSILITLFQQIKG